MCFKNKMDILTHEFVLEKNFESKKHHLLLPLFYPSHLNNTSDI
jgi:hypothetical protein